MKKKEHKHCPICGKVLTLKNKTGYCNHHRPRSGENNPFFGKHHTEENKKHFAITSSKSSKRLWEDPEYRKKVIEGATGVIRTEEFKETQRKNALKQFKDPLQRESRSLKMKESWELGRIVPTTGHHPNYSKEELKFGKQLTALLGRELLRNQSIRLEDGKWILPDFVIGNTVIEYLGNYWHADPNIYKAGDIVHHGITAKEIWEKDEKRRGIYKEKGYRLIEVWSQDFLNNPEETLQKIAEQLKEG